MRYGLNVLSRSIEGIQVAANQDDAGCTGLGPGCSSILLYFLAMRVKGNDTFSDYLNNKLRQRRHSEADSRIQDRPRRL